MKFTKAREKSGIDTQIAFTDRDVVIQEKIRTEKYWNNRQKDIYVELKNDYRGGDGWFKKYQGNVDYLGYYWIKDDISEIYFVLYNSDFFSSVQSAIDMDLPFYPKSHLQKNSNGSIGGKTSGCIIEQKYLIGCEVARFKFDNNKFKKLALKENKTL